MHFHVSLSAMIVPYLQAVENSTIWRPLSEPPARGVPFDSLYSLYRCILSQPQLARAELPLLVELGDSGQKIPYQIEVVENIRCGGKKRSRRLKYLSWKRAE
jgi:hypothetical protein